MEGTEQVERVGVVGARALKLDRLLAEFERLVKLLGLEGAVCLGKHGIAVHGVLLGQVDLEGSE